MVFYKLKFLLIYSALILFAACSNNGQGGANSNSIELVNRLPEVDAGSDQDIYGSQTVYLVADGIDWDGRIDSYEWKQTIGPEVQLVRSGFISAYFEAPLVDSKTTLEFSIKVTDNSRDSTTDFVAITLYPSSKFMTHPMSAIMGKFDDPISDVKIVGNIAYVLAGILKIFDISNPLHPILLGDFQLPINPSVSIDTIPGAKSIAVNGTIAYLTTSSYGFHIVDVSNPNAPFLLSRMDLEGSNDSVVISGDIAYIINFYGTLYAVDVSDPFNPKKLDSESGGMSVMNSISVVGDKAYIAGGESGLGIFDISVPQDIRLVSTLEEVGTYVRNVAVTGNIAYVDDLNSGLANIVDISDHMKPVKLGSIGNEFMRYFAGPMTIVGTTAYIVNYTSGLYAFDITDPVNPVLLGNLNTPGFSSHMAIVDNIAYVSDQDYGLLMVDLSRLAQPALSTYYDVNLATEVFIDADIAYITDYNGIKSINITDPARPILYSSIDMPVKSSFSSIVVAGNIAYVAAGPNGLQIIDFTDPRNPSTLSSLNNLGTARVIAKKETIVYLVSGYGDLWIIDVTDPRSPTILGELPYSNSSVDTLSIAVSGNIVCMGTGYDGLHIIDVSNPNNPVRKAKKFNQQEEWFHITDVALIGSIAYVLNHGVAQLIDVSQPEEPRFLGGFSTPNNASSMKIIGDVGYLVDREYDAIQFFDVTYPKVPTLLGEFNTPKDAEYVTALNKKAFVMTNNAMSLVELGDMTLNNYSSGSPGSALQYMIDWEGPENSTIKCQVTGGECMVTINNINQTAAATWILPEFAGDHDISVAIGNHHYWQQRSDSVVVQ